MVAETIEARRVSRAMQLVCIWCAIPMVLLLFVGMLLAGLMPPPSPSESAAEVAEHYRSNNDAIRAGVAISLGSVIFLYPFFAVIAARARRIESGTPVFTTVLTASYAAASIFFIAPWVCWQVAAYRPERADTEIALMHDFGWIFFVFGGVVSFVAFNFALGLTILSDRKPQPVYPRWFGYYNIFVAIGFLPGGAIGFFRGGPFAWDGMFPYWIPFIIYGVWIAMSVILTTQAIKREAAEENTAALTNSAALESSSAA